MTAERKWTTTALKPVSVVITDLAMARTVEVAINMKSVLYDGPGNLKVLAPYSKDLKSFFEINKITTQEYGAHIDISDFDDVRKMAVAGFKFQGADVLREQEAQLRQLNGPQIAK